MIDVINGHGFATNSAQTKKLHKLKKHLFPGGWGSFETSPY
jgi:hypothetical protein